MSIDQVPDVEPAVVNRSDEQVRPWDRRTLCRELAAGDMTRAALARKYGISRPAVTQFAKRHAAEIDAIKANLTDEFAGLWIADKSARIAAYQADVEASAGGAYGSHYEQIRTRTLILKAVAEELGQLPGKQPIISAVVQHIIVGVDLEQLT